MRQDHHRAQNPRLLARLDAAVRQVNTTRAALIEAMVEAKLALPPLPPPPPAFWGRFF